MSRKALAKRLKKWNKGSRKQIAISKAECKTAIAALRDPAHEVEAVLRMTLALFDDDGVLFDAADHQVATIKAARSLVAEKVPRKWYPIETAPKDRWIGVYAPGDKAVTGAVDDLPDITCVCLWHEEAGFCVDEIRHPTLWCEIEFPPLPAAK